MSIQKLTPDDFEYFTLETNPRRTFSSSSSGVTGSVFLFPRRSSIEKEVHSIPNFRQSVFNDQNLDEYRNNVLRLTSRNISSSVITYMSAVNAQQESVRKQQQISINRFTPPFSFNANTLAKSATINMLMKYYRTSYPLAHFAYTNYHCLNFYTASNVPTASVLLYPNPLRTNSTSKTQYGFSGSFSIDFWIKPKYTTEGRDSNAVYKPGCLLHLTSSYAVTLHTGSSKDINGYPDAFRLMLQLSQSTDVAPDLAASQVSTAPFIFMSDDNSISRNDWNHCSIRWGGTNYNFGSGSFIINGATQGTFVISNSLIGVGNQNFGDPSVLCVGNYYQGTNNGPNALTAFFTNDTAQREGLYELDSGVGFSPGVYSFNYPLNAEVHDIKIYESYLNENQIKAISGSGAKITSDLLFYLPPFFTEDSPVRKFYGSDGGILVSPFFTRDGSTKHPFSVDMAFSCGGHYINLENYVREFITGRYPRLWNLSASTAQTTTDTLLSANSWLYSTGSIRKRLYSILPNDNGKHIPNFNLLSSLSGTTFKTDLGIYEPGFINLRNMITSSFPSQVSTEPSGNIVDKLFGSSPENVGTTTGNSLAIYHRTRDNTSNQVVFFDISNIFYGNQIKPGSFSITDTSLSGSDGKVKITLKDDGYGSLYRADNSSGIYPLWQSVGNIFYNEGIVLLKMPQLYFFGENSYEMNFAGVQNLHVLSMNAFARTMQLVSSSNPSYLTGSVDDGLANIEDSRYVYITHVNIHDDNLNVISRTALAQPLLKRSSDKYLLKIKFDF